jgi:hypothetical protein
MNTPPWEGAEHLLHTPIAPCVGTESRRKSSSVGRVARSDCPAGEGEIKGLSESLNENFPYFHQLAAVEALSCATEWYPAECGQSVG